MMQKQINILISRRAINPSDIMKIGFVGHTDKLAKLFQLEMLMDAFYGATWIHGDYIGFDLQVDTFAKQNKIKEVLVSPDYLENLPKDATRERNKKIVDDCDILVALYDGRKTGHTFESIEYARSIRKDILFLTSY